MKESERKVVAKPVASRPSCSSVRTFTDLLADSVTVSPQSNCHETVDASIIPKTERFKQPASASVSSPRVIHLSLTGRVIFFLNLPHWVLDTFQSI